MADPPAFKVGDRVAVGLPSKDGEGRTLRANGPVVELVGDPVTAVRVQTELGAIWLVALTSVTLEA